jgi:hypothetical protein
MDKFLTRPKPYALRQPQIDKINELAKLYTDREQSRVSSSEIVRRAVDAFYAAEMQKAESK